MDQYRVKPRSRINLDKFDANDTGAFDGPKKEGLKRLLDLNQKLGELQEVLYAGQKERLLIVLQAMDSGGKDGTIRSVFDGVNPQGVRVASFKVPTPEEIAHDYLWRIHKQTPAKGEIVIFNRSHYEDVLVVRVHELVPPKVWGKRYRQINEFERILAEEGTTILKFFLMIDQEEQRLRMLERIKNQSKQWKFNPNDLEERKLWNQYMKAYEDVLEKTSTSWAPWYIIPANRNWYRNLVISDILVETLKKLKLKFPTVVENIDSYAAALEKDGPVTGG
jgi:PPK2 family polyphosphate:nucleotide phosphotransferase